MTGHTHHELGATNLTLGYRDDDVIRELSLSIPAGKITMIVGANASGKSTLLRGLARLLRPSCGAVILDGTSIHDLRTLDVAKVIGLLPQTPLAPDGITVGDLVSRGRYPHQGWFRRWNRGDDVVVADALQATGTTELLERSVAELSGGQRQRVWIAMALAQDTDLLLLDEPTTHLDINHQIELLDLLTDLNRSSGKTIVAVLHELNLACRYANHLIAMKDGAIAAQGDPREIVTARVVTNVFGLACDVVLDPISATPLVVPRGRHHAHATGSAPSHEILLESGEHARRVEVGEAEPVARGVTPDEGDRAAVADRCRFGPPTAA
jgi:iron complex transport system ATP-binding protein